jgi:hypothetical protein
MTVTISNPPLITGVRNAMATVLTAEFQAEGIVFDRRQINPSDTVAQVSGAVFFLDMTEDPQAVAQVVLRYGIQIYDVTADQWETTTDAYDPTPLEAWVNRAVVALKANEHAVGVWFLRTQRVALSQDSSGNPSQGEIIVRAFTANPYDAPNI